ncbi:MAG: rod shape-determining protein [Oscillospiraceae bacterium]|nr:rod shape-determining protein [Oscillospiraceae bacterium]
MALEIMAPDVAIDMGTCFFRLAVKGKGIVLYEPTLAVVSIKSKRNVEAIGEDARLLLGRVSNDIQAEHPIVDGVIADFQLTEMMLRYFLRKAIGGLRISKPRIVISVPCGLTAVERRAIDETSRSAGARAVHVVDQPFAAALGTGLPVYEPMGSMLVDIGGGTTEVALISCGGLVVSRSIRIAGNKMDEAIVHYMKTEHKILISDRIAEDLKIDIGSAVPPRDARKVVVRGRDVVTGLPRHVEVEIGEIYTALGEPLEAVVEAVRWVLERTPPELASDVLRAGVYLTGGGAQLTGLDVLIATELGVPVQVAKTPDECVVWGAYYLAENMDIIPRIGQGDTMVE